MIEVKERKPKRRNYNRFIAVRLRDSQIEDMDKLKPLFGMTISEMVREAVTQWIGQAMNDYSDRLRGVK
jgi:predicted DNA-binding protein